MITVYVYVLDTLADWELGFVTAELHSGRFFKRDAERVLVKTVGCSKEPVRTMGGLTVVPDCTVGDISAEKTDVLLLPGADTWGEEKNSAAVKKAAEFLSAGATVGAICGATVALANFGLLDNRHHTSNGRDFLEQFAPSYKGSALYVDDMAAEDGNLITAGAAGALPWAKRIIAHLDVFRPDTLELWHDYFSTGNAESFFAMMKTLQPTE